MQRCAARHSRVVSAWLRLQCSPHETCGGPAPHRRSAPRRHSARAARCAPAAARPRAARGCMHACICVHRPPPPHANCMPGVAAAHDAAAPPEACRGVERPATPLHNAGPPGAASQCLRGEGVCLTPQACEQSGREVRFGDCGGARGKECCVQAAVKGAPVGRTCDACGQASNVNLLRACHILRFRLRVLRAAAGCLRACCRLNRCGGDCGLLLLPTHTRCTVPADKMLLGRVQCPSLPKSTHSHPLRMVQPTLRPSKRPWTTTTTSTSTPPSQLSRSRSWLPSPSRSSGWFGAASAAAGRP